MEADDILYYATKLRAAVKPKDKLQIVRQLTLAVTALKVKLEREAV